MPGGPVLVTPTPSAIRGSGFGRSSRATMRRTSGDSANDTTLPRPAPADYPPTPLTPLLASYEVLAMPLPVPLSLSLGLGLEAGGPALAAERLDGDGAIALLRGAARLEVAVPPAPLRPCSCPCNRPPPWIASLGTPLPLFLTSSSGLA